MRTPLLGAFGVMTLLASAVALAAENITVNTPNGLYFTGFSEKDAAAAIKATDRRRKTYYEKYTQGRWGSIESHQMLLNVSRLGMERTVEIIRGIYEA